MMEELQNIERPVPRPWGFWATIGFTVIYAIALIITQTLVVIIYTVYAALSNPNLNTQEFGDSLNSNGFLLSLNSISFAFIGIGLVMLFCGIRKGITIIEYLCFSNISWKALAKWGGAALLFIAVWDLISLLIEHPIVPEVDIKVFATAYYTPLLWLAIIVAAPLSEEIFFRGFLFKGIQHSILGPIGAMAITAALWAGIHMQYGLYDKTAIFMGGLMLGYARYKSDSLYPSIAMHSLINLVATIETTALIKLSV